MLRILDINPTDGDDAYYQVIGIIKGKIGANAYQAAQIGGWPSNGTSAKMLMSYLPGNHYLGYGLTPGIIYTCDPVYRARLCAQLAYRYQPQAIAEIRQEFSGRRDRPTMLTAPVYFLSAFALSSGEKIDKPECMNQAITWARRMGNSKYHFNAAMVEWEALTRFFNVEDGVAFLEPGCRKTKLAAYLRGHDWVVRCCEDRRGGYIVETFHDSLGVEDMHWPRSRQGYSGLMRGQRHVARVATKEILFNDVIPVIRKYLGSRRC